MYRSTHFELMSWLAIGCRGDLGHEGPARVLPLLSLIPDKTSENPLIASFASMPGPDWGHAEVLALRDGFESFLDCSEKREVKG